ncbi:MAG: phosphoribosyltransferase family protein, partial [Pseudomonadota bacterium]
MEKTVILNKEQVRQNIWKLAAEIIKNNKNMDDVVLVGIRTGGAYLAARLQTAIAELTESALPTGALDITLYRDDWTRIGPKPIVGKTELPFTINDKTVILVDDVLFTGRTVRAA